MNINKFLLIDGFAILIAIPHLLLIKGIKKNFSLIHESNQMTSIKIPQKETLLKLEKSMKYESSGIGVESLLGKWKFTSIWEKDIDKSESLLSRLLKVFSANLEIKKDSSIDNPFQLSVITSIKLGIFSIEFCGIGNLKTKQSLLIFFFNLIQFKSSSNVILQRSLIEPEEKKKPFLKFIALDKDRKWLSARGQTDGVVLWIKDL